MYCTKCGTLAVADAKFCSKCGNPISADITEKHSEAPAVKADIAKPRKLSVVWLFIVGVLLVGADAGGLFIPAFLGHSVNPQSGFYSMVWTGLFFFLLWKRRARKGWHGALVGAAVGVLVFCVASFVEGFMRRGAGP